MSSSNQTDTCRPERPLSYLNGGGVPENPSAGATRGETRGNAREPPPTTLGGAVDILDLLSLGFSRCGIISGGVTREGFELDRPPVPLHALSHAGQDSGTRGGKQPPTFCTHGVTCLSHGRR